MLRSVLTWMMSIESNKKEQLGYERLRRSDKSGLEKGEEAREQAKARADGLRLCVTEAGRWS
jgi:hypothetical protein